MAGTIFVKRTRCHACGGPKLTRPRTGYVYCDYCGVLCDFDFRVAMETPRSAAPGPAYEALLRQLTPELAAARKRQDQARFTALQEQLYGEYVARCPAAVPVRCADPGYREAWVRYTAASITAMELDQRWQALQKEMSAAAKRLQWRSISPMRVAAQTFWPMFDAVRALTERGAELIEANGLLDLHPDRPPLELVVRIGQSLFAQGWVPCLDDGDAERLLVETRLKGDYTEISEPLLVAARCPGCGDERKVAPGARRVVCESCGRLDELGALTVACLQCGGPVTFPPGVQMVACESCSVQVRALRHAGA